MEGSLVKGCVKLDEQNKWMQLQSFLKEYEDMYEDRDQAVEDFLRFYKGEEMENNYIKMEESMNVLEQAMMTEALRKKKNLIERSLEIWPENLDAQIYQAFMLEGETAFELLDALDRLVDNYNQKQLKQVKEGGYYDSDNRAYFRLLKARVTLCLEEALHSQGIRYAQEGLDLEEMDPMGFRYDLMSFYVLTDDYKAARALFMKYGSDDTALAFNVMTSAVLNRDLSYARNLIQTIQEEIPDIYKLFKNNRATMEKYLNEVHPAYFQPGTLEEIVVAMQPLVSLYYSSEALMTFVRDNISMPTNHSQPKTFAEQSAAYPYMSDDDFMEHYPEWFAGIDLHRAYIIYQAGYDTLEKLENATYKDITAIPGIGKATAEQLRDNGFKLP